MYPIEEDSTNHQVIEPYTPPESSVYGVEPTLEEPHITRPVPVYTPPKPPSIGVSGVEPDKEEPHRSAPVPVYTPPLPPVNPVRVEYKPPQSPSRESVIEIPTPQAQPPIVIVKTPPTPQEPIVIEIPPTEQQPPIVFAPARQNEPKTIPETIRQTPSKQFTEPNKKSSENNSPNNSPSELFEPSKPASQAPLAPYKKIGKIGRKRKYESTGIYGDIPIQKLVLFRHVKGRHIASMSQDMIAYYERYYFRKPTRKGAKNDDDYNKWLKCWERGRKWVEEYNATHGKPTAASTRPRPRAVGRSGNVVAYRKRANS